MTFRDRRSLGIAYHRRALDDVLIRAAQIDPNNPLIEHVNHEILERGLKLGYALLIKQAVDDAKERRKKP